jgi:tetratricopeptide (TPR) repeat protein
MSSATAREFSVRRRRARPRAFTHLLGVLPHLELPLTLASLFWCLLGTLVAPGCGPSLPARYVEQASQARNSVERGEYLDAARHWEAAASLAGDAKYHDEALYRAAVMYLRANETERGSTLLKQLSNQAHGERAARACFELCRIELRRGAEAEGRHCLVMAVRRFPASGMAPNAVRQYSRWLSSERGDEAAIRYLQRELSALSGSEVEQTLHFELARLQERAGHSAQALATYLVLVERFPYPDAVHWDEASLHAARLAQTSGQFALAEKLLVHMLEQRERSSITGSYDRRYPLAQYRLAELYLQMGRKRQALTAFLKVPNEYPTSRLRDNALWRAATVLEQQGDRAGACRQARTLREQEPGSRYARCASAVCVELPADPRCADYVLRELEAARQGHPDLSGIPSL